MKQTTVLLLLLSSILFAQNHPFPQAVDFVGCIKPSNFTQEALNDSVSSLYDDYKSSYLKSYGSDQYYIKANGEGPGGSSSLTVSEAHGYGMIILALMAGYDANAQTEFDGMYRFFVASPSESNTNLMSWLGDIESSSATDGDMDIAYALLLADQQWGSAGTIDYKQEAIRVITNGIKADEFSSSTKRSMLGDWDEDDYSTRSSDWMPGHHRAYAKATGDIFWDQAADTVYSMISSLVSNYAPSTGLLPDFITGSTPIPDYNSGGTGEAHPTDYWFNACRDPWRIALDYAHNGTPTAKTFTDKISSWLTSETGADPENIYAGYSLSGNGISNYRELTFMAPFAAGLITNSANQAFLNDLWSWIVGEGGDNAYAHALNLLSQLLISGNWWAPNSTPSPVAAMPVISVASTLRIAQQNTQFTLSGLLQNSAQVRFYNPRGQTLFSTNLSAQQGVAQFSLPSNLGHGILMMEVTTSTEQLVRRVHF